MKLIINFKDNVSEKDIQLIKSFICNEIYLNKRVSSIHKFRDQIESFEFIKIAKK